MRLKNSFSLLLICTVILFFIGQPPVQAQQRLSDNPDPNKCYVRVVEPDEYVFIYEDYLTYTPEEAARYPHQELELEISPEYSQWESTRYDGCESDDPNDCQVLFYKTYPAKTITIYDPINDTIGAPHWMEVEFKELVEKDGLTHYEEIDCALISSFKEIPLSWDIEEITALTPQDKNVLDDRIVGFLRDKDDIRIQINVHTSTNGMVQELEDISSGRIISILDYLKDRFINTDRVMTRACGGKQPVRICGNPTPCTDLENNQNERVLFRVLTANN